MKRLKNRVNQTRSLTSEMLGKSSKTSCYSTKTTAFSWTSFSKRSYSGRSNRFRLKSELREMSSSRLLEKYKPKQRSPQDRKAIGGNAAKINEGMNNLTQRRGTQSPSTPRVTIDKISLEKRSDRLESNPNAKEVTMSLRCGAGRLTINAEIGKLAAIEFDHGSWPRQIGRLLIQMTRGTRDFYLKPETRDYNRHTGNPYDPKTINVFVPSSFATGKAGEIVRTSAAFMALRPDKDRKSLDLRTFYSLDPESEVDTKRIRELTAIFESEGVKNDAKSLITID